ncbi:hypothetical protein BX616_006099 [Lobosporangium transversale]|uniref:Uncharacterized protein n=1 Tax=Lobosporangium transversale TaxID=64571 RepID=A0A1Y2G9F0_9FUNG|nr:hypothetical protein BCR41DRAFT_401469 [Lobosporangium transversale]KAF9915459.1 hypothetical protein BX616_006099 [Lobosporangium transversale]ORZ01827.1 hypothetical protein BCR41DRAFT_401469 [Lobosporangium transversale]|eukprot:XP_021876124.1 hypothetical protein BCR41DRAFT_401469 [Lobosporangium transversale]
MSTISLHQTSRHAILVIHTSNIDPLSVSATVEHKEKEQISLKYCSQAQVSHTWTIQPVLHIPGTTITTATATTTRLIQDCTHSVSAENLVIKIIKTQQPIEWQGLLLKREYKAYSSHNSSFHEKDQDSTDTTALFRFATSSNTECYQNKLRSTQLWDSLREQGQLGVVGNIQAKKVPGTNSIRMSADLVPSKQSLA